MLETFDTAQDQAQAAATAVLDALSAALAQGARASLMVTGGRSPGPVYDRLAQADIAWDRVDVTLSDERFVPVDDPASNEALVRERLLQGQAAAARFTPLMRPQAQNAEASAQLAEAEVAALAPFHMSLLGMGPDGHVASLIPGAQRLAEAMDTQRFCLGLNEAIGDPPRPRITLTLHALLQSRAILLLVSGAEKRRVVEQALAGADLPVCALLTQTTVPVRVLWTA